jgi:hypothetical protein
MQCLSDSRFVQNHTWGGWLQGELAKKLGLSPGQIRTIKRACENLRLLKVGALNHRSIPSVDAIITTAGGMVLEASELEQRCRTHGEPGTQDETLKVIRSMYQSAYRESMWWFHYRISEVPLVRLHPLRAILKAFIKYGSLDKWEWYLLNTFIRSDDEPAMEAALDVAMESYRAERLTFTMSDVTENPKGHQYLPQILAYSGLVRLTNGRNWEISNNDNYADLKQRILSENFLREIYRIEA